MAKSKQALVVDKYAPGMFVRQEQYAMRVKSRYDVAVSKLLDLARQVKDEFGDRKFSFSENPRIQRETTLVIRQLYSQVYQDIRDGVEAEWEYANASCDALVGSVFSWKNADQNLLAKYFYRNKKAMDQFFQRTQAEGGLNLSQRVWKYTSDLRTEMENAITVSLGEGVSASTMSRRVRDYLREPEKLFRRVRGADGELHLSKNAKAFHPGAGVYRSSYKNAMRLTRTETNAAYRYADEDRWQRMDFVVGIEIKKSNNHPSNDVCDILCGKYPKDFKFSAFHPQCRCYVVPILCTKDEMARLQRNILAGNEVDNYGFKSVNEVTSPPKEYQDWLYTNASRIKNAVSKPYFIRDNRKYCLSVLNSKEDRKKAILDARQKRHAMRDEYLIRHAWNSRTPAPAYMTQAEFEALSKTMKLTDKERYILYESDDLYIDSAWSRTINSELAKNKIGKTVPKDFMDKGSYEQIITLDKVIAKNSLPEETWLYRKVSPYWLQREGIEFKTGNIITEYGFTSTSAVEGANVMRKGKDVLLEIRAPKGTKAFVSSNSAESEVILPRNSKFKVVSVSDRSGKTVVRLEVYEEKMTIQQIAEQRHAQRPADYREKIIERRRVTQETDLLLQDAEKFLYHSKVKEWYDILRDMRFSKNKSITIEKLQSRISILKKNINVAMTQTEYAAEMVVKRAGDFAYNNDIYNLMQEVENLTWGTDYVTMRQKTKELSKLIRPVRLTF